MRSLILTAIVSAAVCLGVASAKDSPTTSESPQTALAGPQMITVDVKLIEVSQTKMSELGVDLTTFDGEQLQEFDGKLAFQQMSSTTSASFVEALVKNRAARVITEPKIATTSGREARLSIGSQSEQSDGEATANENSGIELRTTPDLLADGRVQVQVFLKYSWQEKENDQSATANRVRHFSLDTGVVSQPGESTLISGLAVEDSRESYLLIVTPDVVESTASTLPSKSR